MRVSGIVACILTAAAACTPCLALNTTDAGAAAARSQAPALAKTAKAKSPKKAEQPAQQSTITFYWAKGAEGSSLFNVFREKIILTVDGQAAGKLTQGEYISVPVQPGHHAYGYERVAISSEGETKREVDVPQGQSVYFEIAEKNEAGFMHTLSPQQVTAEQAQAEVSRLKAPLQTAGASGVPGAGAATGNAPLPVVGAAAPQTRGKPGKKGAAPQAIAQSYIVFYWPKRSSGSMSFLTSLSEHIGVAIDDQSAGSIGEGEYISVPVQPGSHSYSWAKASTISLNDKKHPLDIQPGQSAYFEIAEQQQGMVNAVYPQQVQAEQAQPLLAGLKSPGAND
jgi:hypothetical protein